MISSYISKGIIEAEELKALLDGGEVSVRVLDASYALPGSGGTPYQNFLHERIDHAQFFDIQDVCNKQSPLPHMLPDADLFARAAGGLGISNEDLVVIYGQAGMVMGPARAWWMFRVFGHDRVCVLNGGLPAWKRAGLDVVTGPPREPEQAAFSASFRPHLVRDMAEMRQVADNHLTLVLDARPAERFSGQAAEPRPGMRAGHIPGSKNLPCTSLVDSQSGKLKPGDILQAMCDEAGVQAGRPILTTCGSGVTACMIALALHSLGYTDIPVYDGSWSEWGLEASGTPVESGVGL